MSNQGGPIDFSAALTAAGVRMTRPRKLILRVLAERGDRHPDAMDIFRRVVREDDKISLPTVYRTLKMLEDHGLIQRHAFTDSRSRYEPAGGPHHDHLIDMDTGDVIEFRSDEIEKLQEQIARELGYEIVHHRLELYARRIKSERPANQQSGTDRTAGHEKAGKPAKSKRAK